MATAARATPLSCMNLVHSCKPHTLTRTFTLSQTRSIHTRKLHSSSPTQAPASPLLLPPGGRGSSRLFLPLDKADEVAATSSSPSPRTSTSSPLGNVTWTNLIRSLVVQHSSSIPVLFKPSLAILSFLSDAKSAALSPDRNPLLRRVLRTCFYDMFCAGENKTEVANTTRSLQAWGVRSIMLCWAREVVYNESAARPQAAAETGSSSSSKSGAQQLIHEWAAGNLNSVRFANAGDIVAIKLSGAGPLVLDVLQNPDRSHDELFMDYCHQICRLAQSKGVGLTIDAESFRIQSGIDALTMSLARQYNGNTPGSSVVKNTYQAYLKSVPAKLSRDLETAAREGFTLGVKLVRGAYLATEKRSVIWPTKEATDAAYDGIAEGLLRRDWGAGGFLAGGGAFPQVDLVLATHNLTSVKKAGAIRQAQLARGESPIRLMYAQLMGMADHVSAEAIRASVEEAKQVERDAAVAGAEKGRLMKEKYEPAGVQKYLAWGTVGECMKYLVRRAEENNDAVARTEESRMVLWQEVKRRVFG